jgi:hypothetical protein
MPKPALRRKPTGGKSEARDLNHAVDLISNHPGVKAGPWEIRPPADLSAMVRWSEARRRAAGPA